MYLFSKSDLTIAFTDILQAAQQAAVGQVQRPPCEGQPADPGSPLQNAAQVDHQFIPIRFSVHNKVDIIYVLISVVEPEPVKMSRVRLMLCDLEVLRWQSCDNSYNLSQIIIITIFTQIERKNNYCSL